MPASPARIFGPPLEHPPVTAKGPGRTITPATIDAASSFSTAPTFLERIRERVATARAARVPRVLVEVGALDSLLQLVAAAEGILEDNRRALAAR